MLLTRYCHACAFDSSPEKKKKIKNKKNWLTSFRAQGAAQAFEDAGVLGAIFSQPVGRDQIPDALRVFEEVRKPRASAVRHRTLDQKAMFAMADGLNQEERDAKLRAGADYPLFEWLWDYNAAESGREAWKRHGNRIETRHHI